MLTTNNEIDFGEKCDLRIVEKFGKISIYLKDNVKIIKKFVKMKWEDNFYLCDI